MTHPLQLVAPGVQLPGWLARLCLAALLEKRLGHKYVRRVPTGNPRHPYRYYYNLTGGTGRFGHHNVVEGASFKIADGHVHVRAVHEHHVELEHDETGQVHQMHRDHLADLLHSHHAEEINRHLARHEERRQKTAASRAEKHSKLPRSNLKIADEIEDAIGHDFGTVDFGSMQIQDTLQHYLGRKKLAKLLDVYQGELKAGKGSKWRDPGTAFKMAIAELIASAGRRAQLRTWRDLLDAKVGDRGGAGATGIFDVLREIGEQIDDPALARAHPPQHAIDQMIREEEAEHWRGVMEEDGDLDEKDSTEPEDGDDSWDFGFAASDVEKSLVPVPRWLGVLLMKGMLEKAAGHKYIRRVPTGNPKRPYRYYYRVTGGAGLAHDEEIKAGAAFAIKDSGKLGHFHVIKVDGERVTIRHDESGNSGDFTRAALRDLLHQEHATAIKTTRERATRDVADAEKHGSDKQRSRTKERHSKVEEMFGPAEPKVPPYVMSQLGRHLHVLKEARRKLEEGRVIDTKHGGGGRYEAEVAFHQAERPGNSMLEATRQIEHFRTLAREKGIDPEKVLGELGGVPDVKLSPAAAKYVEDRGWRAKIALAFGEDSVPKVERATTSPVAEKSPAEVKPEKKAAKKTDKEKKPPTPKKGKFQILTRNGGAEREGHVLGDFAMHKEKGEHAPKITHVPSGYSITSTASNKDEAFAVMRDFHEKMPPGTSKSKFGEAHQEDFDRIAAVTRERHERDPATIAEKAKTKARDEMVASPFVSGELSAPTREALLAAHGGKEPTVEELRAIRTSLEKYRRDKSGRDHDTLRKLLGVYPGSDAGKRMLKEIDHLLDAKHAEKITASFSEAGARHWLSDLREKTGLSRADFDQALRTLHESKAVALFHADNPREVTPERASGAHYLSGIPQHIAYLDNARLPAKTAEKTAAVPTADDARKARKKWLEHPGKVGDAERTQAMRDYNAIVDKLPAEEKNRYLQELSDAEEEEIGRKMRAGVAAEEKKPSAAVIRSTVGTPPAPRTAPAPREKTDTEKKHEALVNSPAAPGKLSEATTDLLLKRHAGELPHRAELARHVEAMRKVLNRAEGEKTPTKEILEASKYLGTGAISQVGRAMMREIVAYHDALPAEVTPPPSPPVKTAPIATPAKTTEEISAEVRHRDAEAIRAQLAKPDPKKPPKTARDLLEHHGVRDLHEKLAAGTLTADDARSRYEAFKKNKAQIREHLQGLTKDELGKIAGYNSYDRKKEQLVDSALDSIALSHHPAESFAWSPFTETHEAALDRHMAKVSDADIAAYAAKQQERRSEREKRIAALKEPQTLSDYQTLVRLKGGENKLEPQHLERYDELVADAAREKAEKEHRERHEKRQAFARSREEKPVTATSAKVIAGKHTKKGHDIFTVQLADRVSRDEYKALESKAKALGGYYSSFRGGGAVPGFIFAKPEHANTFAGHVGGGGEGAGAVEAAPAVEAPVEPLGPLHGNAPQRLREQAQSIHGRADEALGRDRQQNTERRARMAAGAEASARREKATAHTLEAIADAQESGQSKHLWGVSTRAHVELLEDALRQAKYRRIQASSDRSEEAYRAEPTLEDVARAEFPHPSVHKDHVRAIAHATKDVDGAKIAAKRLLAHVEKLGDSEWRVHADTSRLRDDLEAVAAAADKTGREKYAASAIAEDLKKYNRAKEGMGIESPAQLRAALREYHKLRQSPEGESRLKKLKRAIVGQKIPGYFPTPRSLGGRVLELADVKPGHKVLEPSAGSGALADLAREAGGDVHTVERHEGLRAILEENGHKVVGRDALQHEGEYDRVVMNPPFEEDQDIDHVLHAFTHQVADGGKLTAIVSRGAVDERSSSRKRQDFQKWLKDHDAHIEDAPEKAFAGADSERKTGVYASVISLEKPHLGTPEGRVYQRGTGSKTWWVRDASSGRTHPSPFESKREALAHATHNEQVLREMSPEKLPRKLRGDAGGNLEKSMSRKIAKGGGDPGAAEKSCDAGDMSKSDMLYGPSARSWVQEYKDTPHYAKALKIEEDSMRAAATVNAERRKLTADPGCYRDPKCVSRLAELDLESSANYRKYEEAKEQLAIECVARMRKRAEDTAGSAPDGSPLEKSLADVVEEPMPYHTVNGLNVVTSSAPLAKSLAAESMRSTGEVDLARRTIRDSRRPLTVPFGKFATFGEDS